MEDVTRVAGSTRPGERSAEVTWVGGEIETGRNTRSSDPREKQRLQNPGGSATQGM